MPFLLRTLSRRFALGFLPLGFGHVGFPFGLLPCRFGRLRFTLGARFFLALGLLPCGLLLLGASFLCEFGPPLLLRPLDGGFALGVLSLDFGRFRFPLGLLPCRFGRLCFALGARFLVALRLLPRNLGSLRLSLETRFLLAFPHLPFEGFQTNLRGVCKRRRWVTLDEIA